MSWTFASQSNFQNITDLVSRLDCTVSLLAHADNIRFAFKKSQINLSEFLVPRIEEIVDIALGNKQCDSDNVPPLCLFFLTTANSTFTNHLTNSHIFNMKLHDFILCPDELDNHPRSYAGMVAFARIMEFLIMYSNGAVLKSFPEMDKIFSKLLSLLSNPGINSLMYFIADHGHQETIDFLESIDASRLIFETINDVDDTVDSNCIIMLTVLVCSGLPTSPLTKCVVDTNRMEKIFQIAINKNRPQKVSGLAFRLLLEICGLFDDEPDDMNNANVYNFMIVKIPEICQYILNDLPFTLSKKVATDLLVGLLTRMNEVPNEFYLLASSLFLRMFDQPTRSTLHCIVMILFEAILDKSKKIFEVCDIRPKIIETYQNREKTDASFWGLLYFLTNRFVDSEVELSEKVEGWADYLENIYYPTKNIIDSGYGGTLPKDTETESDSSDLGIGSAQNSNDNIYQMSYLGKRNDVVNFGDNVNNVSFHPDKQNNGFNEEEDKDNELYAIVSDDFME